jgi:carboxypeptidase C (cathepsin A)
MIQAFFMGSLVSLLALYPSNAVRIFRPDVVFQNPVVHGTSTSHRRLGSVTVPKVNSPSDHLVTSLPLLSSDEFATSHWAGHLPASSSGDKYFFYWLFAPDGDFDETNVPLIVWLNGGPGCSSMDGLFLENGPFRLQKDIGNEYRIKSAEHSWHKAPAYTLYIDQPVGTGLSFTTSDKYPENDEEVNIDFYYFIQSFFHLHADKFVSSNAVRNPLYFSGESHAGHYIPSMMNYILKLNDNLSAGSMKIPLAGAMIGNGWVGMYSSISRILHVACIEAVDSILSFASQILFTSTPPPKLPMVTVFSDVRR